MYTHVWRSSPYPLLPTFDAPDGNTTCTRRTRSNTPLQALTLANDRVFVETARSLALRVLRDRAAGPAAQIRQAFLLCLGREPSAAEQARLGAFLAAQRKFFGSVASNARGSESRNLPAGVTGADAAAWTEGARVLFNLDEFITRE